MVPFAAIIALTGVNPQTRDANKTLRNMIGVNAYGFSGAPIRANSPMAVRLSTHGYEMPRH
jgi:hypothetical protein